MSVLRQRRASFLSPFADTSNMGTVTEMDGVPVEADQLGETQARLGREQQQRVIAASEPCRSIRSGKYRLDLGSGQEMHLALVVSLARYREHALNMSAVGRLLKRGEPEEGADRGQAQVTGPDAGAALLLEILQKRTDERRIQIVESQGRRRLAEPLLSKREQEPERVPVGCDRVRADIALTHEPLGKVALDECGDVAARLHGLASHRRSRRRAASCLNSGQAQRYP